MIEVEMPDGTIVEFPDGTPEATIREVLTQIPPPIPGLITGQLFGGATDEEILSGPAFDARRLIDDIGTAIVGQSEFDLPELSAAATTKSRDPLSSSEDRKRFGVLRGKINLARSDQDIEDIVKDSFPNARFFSDKFGNRFVKIGDDAFALNEAGLSGQDVNQIGSEAAILGATAVPLARGGQAIAQGAGRLGGLFLGTGAGSLLEDELAAQAGAEREVRLDPRKAINLAALGGAFEAGAIAINALSPTIRSAIQSVFGSTALFNAGKLTGRGRRILSDAGIDPDSVTPEAGDLFARLAGRTEDPAAAARQAEAQSLPEPVTLTSGQATRDPTRLALESEAKKGAFGPDPSAKLLTRQEEQQAALSANVPAIQKQIAGETFEPGQGAAKAQNALIKQRAAKKGDVDVAFEAARGQGKRVRISADVVPDIQRSIRRSVEDFDVAGLPRVSGLIDDLGKLTADKRVKKVTLNALERWRRRAVNARSGAATKEEGEAIRRVIKSYDDFLEGAVRDTLLEGDQAAIEAWKRARGVRRRFGQVFEQDDAVNTLTATMRDGSRRLIVGEDEAVNYIFGRSAIGGKRGLAKDLAKLRDTLGETSEEWQAIRGEAFLRFFRNQKGENFPAQSFANELDKAVKDAPAAMKALFSERELNLMQQLKRTGLNVNSRANIVGDVNPSGTARALLLKLKNGFGPIGDIVEAAGARLLEPLRSTKQGRAAVRAATGTLPPLKGRPFPPGVAGSAGAAGGQQSDADLTRFSPF